MKKVTEEKPTENPPGLTITPLRIYRTVCVYGAFMALGWATSLHGVTLVNLEVLYNTDVQTIAFGISLNGFGYLGGSFLAGVLYERFNADLQLAITLCIIGVATMLATWLPHLYGLMAFLVVQGVGMGYLDASIQSYCLHQWIGHRLKKSILLGAHASWSIGMALGALIAEPFLFEVNTSTHVHFNGTKFHTNGNYTTDLPHRMTDILMNLTSKENYLFTHHSSRTNATKTKTILVEAVHSNVTTADVTFETEELERVRYAFVLIGILVCVVSVFFLVAFIWGGSSCFKKPEIIEMDYSKINTRHTDSRNFKTALLVFGFVHSFLCGHIIAVPGSFLPAMVVKGLKWSVDNSSFLMSLFWTTNCVTKILGALFALALSYTKMIIMHIFLSFIGFLVMCFVNQLPHMAIYFSAVIVSFGTSTLFSLNIVFLSSHTTFDARLAAVLIIAYSLGCISGQAIVGYLFQHVTVMAVPYVGVVISAAISVTFTSARGFVYCYGKHSNVTVITDSDDKRIPERQPLRLGGEHLQHVPVILVNE